MTIDQILRAAELSGIARSETQNPEYIFVATSTQLAAWAEKLQATASAMREPPKNTLYLVGYDAEGKRVVSANMTSFDPQRDARVMGAAWEFNNAGERGVSVLAHHIENLVITVVPKKGPTMPAPDDPVVAQRRKAFEAANRDSCGFTRSRKGTYRNPVIARDWKWFQLGVFQRQVEEAEEKAADAKINPPNVNERHPGDTWLGGV